MILVVFENYDMYEEQNPGRHRNEQFQGMQQTVKKEYIFFLLS